MPQPIRQAKSSTASSLSNITAYTDHPPAVGKQKIKEKCFPPCRGMVRILLPLSEDRTRIVQSGLDRIVYRDIESVESLVTKL